MKYPTLRFVFDRRKVTTETRKASIYLEVAFEHKRQDVPTGVHVCINQWSDAKRVIARTDAPDLNAQLGSIESQDTSK